MTKSKSQSRSKDALLAYLQSDLGLDLDQEISIPRVFLRTVTHYKDDVALLEKVDGRYREITYIDLLGDVEAVSTALINLGLSQGAKVGIWLKNSPVWVTTDLGAQLAGLVVVPAFFTLTSAVAHYIFLHCEAQILFVEDKTKLDQIMTYNQDMPNLEWIVVRNTEGIQLGEKILSWDDLLKKGKDLIFKGEVSTSRINAIKRDDLATIIYTSGTTGNPKGVMLSHRNLLATVHGVGSVTNIYPDDRLLSILPLSHVFERVVGYYLPLFTGCSIGYAESPDKLDQNFKEVQPTVCLGVPRIFEKLYEKIIGALKKQNPIKKKLFAWCVKTGHKYWMYTRKQNPNFQLTRRTRHRPEELSDRKSLVRSHPGIFFCHQIAYLLVYRKLKKKLGGKIRHFIVGGAPMPTNIYEFFRNLHILIYEGYGMTETAASISFNYAYKTKGGTVGKLLPYTRVKLGSDGEILVKAPNIMMGYYNDKEATREAFDDEGWLHTGDIGKWGDHNFLNIVDRKKNIIVLSTGKNIAPIPIETTLNQNSLVEASIVIGDNKKYITALIFPSRQELSTLVGNNGNDLDSLEKLCESSDVIAEYQRLVDQVNEEFSPYEQIKKFKVVPYDLAQDVEQILTPTLKLRRHRVKDLFAQMIDQIYQS